MALAQAMDAFNAVQAFLQPGSTGFLSTNNEEDLHDGVERRIHPALNQWGGNLLSPLSFEPLQIQQLQKLFDASCSTPELVADQL